MKKFIALDVETTGFDHEVESIVEIALFPFGENDDLSSNREAVLTKINPGHPIPREATNVHGITDADVANAPFFKDVADAILEFMDGAIIVGHNVMFDIKFLREAFARAGIQMPYFEVIDTVEIAQRTWPEARNHKLKTLTSLLDLDHKAHSALDDARACAQVYLAAQIWKKKEIGENMDINEFRTIRRYGSQGAEAVLRNRSPEPATVQKKFPDMRPDPVQAKKPEGAWTFSTLIFGALAVFIFIQLAG